MSFLYRIVSEKELVELELFDAYGIFFCLPAAKKRVVVFFWLNAKLLAWGA